LARAWNEDSDARTINGNENNSNAPSSGAAYVFNRAGTNWFQRAYLKSSNSDSGDRFGSSVAVSGDTAVVGAQTEDGSASGVNGNSSDNSLSGAGAAYVFVGVGVQSKLSMAQDGRGLSLNWNAVSGLSYQVERASTPNGPWIAFGSFTSSNWGNLSFRDTNAPAGAAFYRVVQRPD
jgi:hypothetical protein